MMKEKSKKPRKRAESSLGPSSYVAGDEFNDNEPDVSSADRDSREEPLELPEVPDDGVWRPMGKQNCR